MAGGRKGGRAKRRKVCYFTANGITRIDYKDVDLLKKFISERGKILPSLLPAPETGAPHHQDDAGGQGCLCAPVTRRLRIFQKHGATPR